MVVCEYIYGGVRDVNMMHVYLYTRNSALAIASALFLPRSRRDSQDHRGILDVEPKNDNSETKQKQIRTSADSFFYDLFLS